MTNTKESNTDLVIGRVPFVSQWLQYSALKTWIKRGIVDHVLLPLGFKTYNEILCRFNLCFVKLKRSIKLGYLVQAYDKIARRRRRFERMVKWGDTCLRQHLSE